jgi:hypothetical protein
MDTTKQFSGTIKSLCKLEDFTLYQWLFYIFKPIEGGLRQDMYLGELRMSFDLRQKQSQIFRHVIAWQSKMMAVNPA